MMSVPLVETTTEQPASVSTVSVLTTNFTTDSAFQSPLVDPDNGLTTTDSATMSAASATLSTPPLEPAPVVSKDTIT